MNVLLLMIIAALGLGGTGLVALVWALNSGQFDDPRGDSARILHEDDKPA